MVKIYGRGQKTIGVDESSGSNLDTETFSERRPTGAGQQHRIWDVGQMHIGKQEERW